MAEERSGTGKLTLKSVDSAEWRWVYQSDEGSEVNSDGEAWAPGDGEDALLRDSDDEEFFEQKLIRTGCKVDSFDVQVLEVPGVKRDDFASQDISLGRRIMLGFQILAVVFGDVGTSPLYTFSVMFSKAPANRKEDILGATSLVLYTLILIPLMKYVFIVLWANDDGEGGTFAIYSLICRHAKVSLLPNHLPSDAHVSKFKLLLPTPELERSLRIKERLETSLTLKKLLLMLVLGGTAMVIADGVVTPAMSVISAVEGLNVGIIWVEQDHVVMISVAILIVLFSVQSYGTSKAGLVFGPALLVWFCSLGGIGIYNLAKHDSRVLQAFNPIHIYYYFKHNTTKAWYSLAGCLLCATGSEAMFADLCYFSLRSVQLTFVFLILPCLLLGYLGQAAYLMENPADTTQAFFASVPNGAFWPVFLIANIAALVASRTMTTATFSCIKQSTALGCFPRLKIIHTSRKFMGQIYIPVMNWFLLALTLILVCNIQNIYEIGNAYGIAEVGVMMMTTTLVTLVMLLIWRINIVIVLCFVIIFLGLELIFLSSVLWSVGDGSWITLVFTVVIFLILSIWNYGSKLKYETEVKEKMSMDLLRKLGPNLGTIRSPGIGLLYNELPMGVPAVFGHFLTTLPAVHSMILFVCVKHVPVSFVPQSERFLFKRVCPRSYHIFRCVARYGYKDVHKENHQIFERLLMESLEKFIRREAQDRSLESDDDSDSVFEETEAYSETFKAPNDSAFSLQAPLLGDFTTDRVRFAPEASTSEEGTNEPSSARHSRENPEQSLEKELSFIHKAKESGVVYLLGNGDIRARKDSWFFKKLTINYFYSFLKNNSRRETANLSIPQSHLVRVRMTYMV
ncbi:potassium transporter 7-like [Andrographis paniculata]|uniref:potassium transporter 7-like n=1 Tax=Andrographis paniculata TaxID=175694 RepID=UPI0021E7010C|nr:potassium transporter 7-like [Andrographis paniculata]